MTGVRLLSGEITDSLYVEKRGHIGWITLNDPERHNAISYDMWDAIPKALEVFENDDDVRAVVLTGAGDRAFASGANIAQFETLRTGKEAVNAYETIADAAQAAIYDCLLPTIARIDGYCIGGGLNVALCCDIRIASLKSSFAIPAGKLGVGYRLGAIRNLVSAVGTANALEIFLTASRYTAIEAHALGLIQKVVHEQGLDEALQICLDRICQNAPLTLRAGKRMIRELQQFGPQVNLEAMYRLVLRCFESDDFREGKVAFAEKRAPRFKGR